jgi:hypothetical protein
LSPGLTDQPGKLQKLSKNESVFTPLRINVNTFVTKNKSFVFNRVQLIHKGVLQEWCTGLLCVVVGEGAWIGFLRVGALFGAAWMLCGMNIEMCKFGEKPRGERESRGASYKVRENGTAGITRIHFENSGGAEGRWFLVTFPGSPAMLEFCRGVNIFFQ